MELAQLLPPQSFDSDSNLDFEAELELAARELDLDPWMVQRLKHAEREITINIPITRADDAATNISAYRVQHSRVQGPCMGPLFFSPAAHPAALRQSATMITLQSALLNSRIGGAAGAIVCDISRFSEPELRQLVSEYIHALRNETGSLLDVFVPQGPSWLMRCVRNAVKIVRGHCDPAAVVGDPVLMSPAASATLALIRRALDVEDLSQLRVAFQGFGHVARPILEALHQEGGRVIAVADRSGAVMRPDGLDCSALCAYVADRGVVFGYPNAEAASNADVLESECDLLVLAAAERQVGLHNAAHLRAHAILELTQNAVSVSPEHLAGRCMLIPYLVAGCAQVAAWSYEWQQGLSYADVDMGQAAELITTRVLAAYERVRQSAHNDHATLSKAATLIALRSLSMSLRP